jgi:hypothetical protein
VFDFGLQLHGQLEIALTRLLGFLTLQSLTALQQYLFILLGFGADLLLQEDYVLLELLLLLLLLSVQGLQLILQILHHSLLETELSVLLLEHVEQFDLLLLDILGRIESLGDL